MAVATHESVAISRSSAEEINGLKKVAHKLESTQGNLYSNARCAVPVTDKAAIRAAQAVVAATVAVAAAALVAINAAVVAQAAEAQAAVAVAQAAVA